jgi:hypothetical protein
MNKTKITYLLPLFFLGLALFSCKPVENKVKVKVKINHRPTKFLIAKLIEKEFQFNSLSGKAAVTYDNGKESSFKTHLRIKKDSAIWISITPVLGIEMARVLITKDTVKLMNRVDKTYFIGDFDYLNKIFSADLDYQMLEALLTGNSMSFERNEKIRSSIDRKKNSYFISTEKKRRVRKEIKKDKSKIKEQTQSLWLNPISYKIEELLLSSPQSRQSLLAKFSDYKEIGNGEKQMLPQSLFFELIAKTPSSINVEYSKLNTSKVLSFPFKIPSKYEQIEK